jgi:hypothetical protein
MPDQHGDDRERADAQHAATMAEFSRLNAELAELRREADARHAAVTELLDRCRLVTADLEAY